MAQSDPPATAQSQPSAQQPPAITQKASTTQNQGSKAVVTAGGSQPTSSSGKAGAPVPTDVKLSVFTKIRNYFLVRKGYKRAGKTGWNGTKLILGLLKETADPFPPLKVTVAGLVALIDIFESTAANKSDMKDTSEYIDRLLGLLAGRLKGDRDTVLSFVREPYTERLTSALSSLAEMKSEGRILRFVNHAEHEGVIRDVCQEIARTLQELQLNIGFSLERQTQVILQEVVLQNLERAKSAAYNAVVPGTVFRRSCTPGTREDAIKDILNWALDLSPDTAPVYWISGLAGQGKTTIAHTVCEQLRSREGRDVSVISFFCSRQLDTSKEELLVSTLAFKLAEVSVSYASELVRILPKDHDLGNQKIDAQMSELLVRPWIESAEHRAGLRPIVVVVDALDENEAGAQFIEHILAASRTEKGLPGLRILITSRPEPSIVPLCKDIGDRTVCRLNDVSPYVVHGDITRYLNDELPDHQGETYLVDVANVSAGLFAFAATVVRIVKTAPRKVKMEEEYILRHIATRAPTSIAEGREDKQTFILYDLYDDVVARAFDTTYTDLKAMRMRVLLTVICSDFRRGILYPLNTLSVLAFCADTDEELVRAVVDSLYPVLYIKYDTVFWHHASFQDYILATYKDLVHPTHMRIVRRCLIVWERLLDLAEEGRFATGEGQISRLQRIVAQYQEILERDSPDWPTADDRNEAPENTWATFYYCTSLDHVEISNDNREHKWKTVSEFLSSLRLELQNDSQDMTG